MPGNTLAILSYHQVGYSPPRWQSWFYITPARLRADLELLRSKEYELLGLDALLAGLAEPDCLPNRAAVITFDDGYRNLRELALPVLRQMSAPAIVFIPPRWMGGLNGFDYARQPDEAMCDLNDLKALEQGGVAVQSHGLTHLGFSSLTEAELRVELSESKKILERLLSRPVRTISFPFGDAGVDPPHTCDLLKSLGYSAAFTYKGPPAKLPGDKAMLLPRLAIGSTSELAEMLEGRKLG